MRYFLAAWALLVLLVMGIMGFRGDTLRKPPIEIFPDMDRQMKLRPQQPVDFFPDSRGSRLPVAGTVARSEPIRHLNGADANAVAFRFEDSPVTTGRVTGTTNYVDVNPLQITGQFLERGRMRYQISCAPCHGPLADGNGVTKKLGMAVVANLHDGRIVKMSDGELFHVITNGRNLMGPYGPQIAIEDRWAIVAYVRALQLSRLGTEEDVPAAYRSALKK